MDTGILVRGAARLLFIGWIVVPPGVLAAQVARGDLIIGEAVELVVWFIAPWAVVLANIALLRAVLGPGRRRQRGR